ncbi:hypothetical protein [Deinococcus peraridilitoris]|uniref:Uncharacterized protein n=1 Tax=Deinococcus peraridilitoris (strain DSM 19664 / LMG 22246 / CIP 109416 / KR-200) TaxID=937777 RepID=L0A953_DEIPD|nr:hypothetical protein [Deinococcus peraridilitoris]AFZ69585.1 hypothetical protein Deipe_4226 [Deinococcus peraridilitoris DSM 19664]
MHTRADVMDAARQALALEVLVCHQAVVTIKGSAADVPVMFDEAYEAVGALVRFVQQPPDTEPLAVTRSGIDSLIMDGESWCEILAVRDARRRVSAALRYAAHWAWHRNDAAASLNAFTPEELADIKQRAVDFAARTQGGRQDVGHDHDRRCGLHLTFRFLREGGGVPLRPLKVKPGPSARIQKRRPCLHSWG